MFRANRPTRNQGTGRLGTDGVQMCKAGGQMYMASRSGSALSRSFLCRRKQQRPAGFIPARRYVAFSFICGRFRYQYASAQLFFFRAPPSSPPPGMKTRDRFVFSEPTPRRLAQAGRFRPFWTHRRLHSTPAPDRAD